MNITQPEIIIVALITAAVSAITGFLTWLFGRRKSDAEIAEISSRVYNNLVKDLESRVTRQGQTIREQDERLEKIYVYVEQLERLLLTHNVIQRYELEEIKNDMGL
jgi:hypothetical protein